MWTIRSVHFICLTVILHCQQWCMWEILVSCAVIGQICCTCVSVMLRTYQEESCRDSPAQSSAFRELICEFPSSLFLSLSVESKAQWCWCFSLCSFMFDEPSSYLDVKQRLRAAITIRSLISPDRCGKTLLLEGENKMSELCLGHTNCMKLKKCVCVRV